jgi:multidrug efflux pump subunit AcrA (membrane-fusion protein)
VRYRRRTLAWAAWRRASRQPGAESRERNVSGRNLVATRHRSAAPSTLRLALASAAGAAFSPRVLAALLTLTACRPSEEAGSAETAAPIKVEVATVRRGEIADVRHVTGEVAALKLVRLAAPVAGRVTYVGVQPGDRLAAGDVAARLLPTENEAALQGYGVLERGKTLPPEERSAAQRLERMVRAGDVPLRAPFHAVVSGRLHNPGELVAQNDVLLDLFDPRSVYVVAQVPLEMARDVASGMPVEIKAPGFSAAGAVSVVVPAVAAQALTVPVRINFETPPVGALLSATVDCRITVATHGDTLLIPRRALLESRVGAQGAVMIALGTTAARRSIALGLRNDSEVEVISGLAPGDRVLVNGQYALPDGAAIEAVAPTPRPTAASRSG